MEIELVPRLGARLPRGGGLLDFGATEEDARRRLESFGPTQSSFTCGESWNWRVRVGDRWVEAGAGADGLLGEIRVVRAIETGWGEPTGIAVVYRGIDVFAHTMAEVEFLIGATEPGGSPGLRLIGTAAYAQSATLVDLTRRPTRGI